MKTPTPVHSVVIVGASVAGVATADRLRSHGFAGSIILLDQESEQPYDKPPLSKQILVGQQQESDIRLRRGDHFARLGIELRTGSRALHADLDRRVVTTTSAEIHFDALVIASGVRPKVPADWSRHTAVPTLRTLDDARGLRARWQKARSLIVVGGGFLGLEVAASAIGHGLAVDVVEPQPEPLEGIVGEAMGRRVAELHRQSGVKLHTGVAVAELKRIEDRWSVELSDGRMLVADDLLVSIGTAPNTEWLDEATLELADGVVCDSQCRSSADGVYAVGDVARVRDRYLGQPLRIEHWTNALDTAELAGRAIVGLPPASSSMPHPYFWSHQYGHKIQMLGKSAGFTDCVFVQRPERSAEDAGLFVYLRDGEVVGALAHNWPTVLAHLRRHLREGVTAMEFLGAVAPSLSR